MIATKLCKACGQEKLRSSFGAVKSNPDGLRYACKACYNATRRLYRDGHSEQIASYKMGLYYKDHENQKARLRARYPKTRAWLLLRKYGLTVEQYTAMVESQGGKCAICQMAITESGKGKRGTLHVDHCHQTNTIRGLLCNSCNVGLGSFRDNVESLAKAIVYLESAKQPETKRKAE